MTTSSDPHAADGATTPRQRLNDIARGWTPTDGFDQDVSQREIAKTCWSLLDETMGAIVAMVADAWLDTEEALAWALSRSKDHAGRRLHERAVAVCLSVFDGLDLIALYQSDPEDLEAQLPVEEWVTPETVRELERAAESQYERIIFALGGFQLTDPEAIAENPRPVILDQATGAPAVESRGVGGLWTRTERGAGWPAADPVVNRPVSGYGFESGKPDHRHPLNNR